tara:strand:+ start:299 stop:460 length:162 start_codon:yes stop_codon:yes gene_type:complete
MWDIINKFGDVVVRNLTISELDRFIGKNKGKEYQYKEQKSTLKEIIIKWINKN